MRVKLPQAGDAGRPLAALTVQLPSAPGRYELCAVLQADGWHDEATVTVKRLPDGAPTDGTGLVLLGRGLRSMLPAAHTSLSPDWRGPVMMDLHGTLSIDPTLVALKVARAGAHVCLVGMNPYWADWFNEFLEMPVVVHGARGNFMGMHHYRRAHPMFAGLGGPGLADGSWAETLPAWGLEEIPDSSVIAGCFSVPDGGRDFLWRATVQTVPLGQGRLTFWQLPLGQRRGGTLGGQLLPALVRWLTDAPQ